MVTRYTTIVTMYSTIYELEQRQLKEYALYNTRKSVRLQSIGRGGQMIVCHLPFCLLMTNPTSAQVYHPTFYVGSVFFSKSGEKKSILLFMIFKIFVNSMIVRPNFGSATSKIYIQTCYEPTFVKYRILLWEKKRKKIFRRQFGKIH